MPLRNEDQARDIASVPPVDQPTTTTFSPVIFRPGYLRSMSGSAFLTHSSASQNVVHSAVIDVDFCAEPVVEADAQTSVFEKKLRLLGPGRLCARALHDRRHES